MMPIKYFIAMCIVACLGMIGTYMIGLDTSEDLLVLRYERGYREGAKANQDMIEKRAADIYDSGTDLTIRDLDIILFGESQE